MSQRAQPGQMAGDMPADRCGRTFLGTFCFSGFSWPHPQTEVSGRDKMHEILVRPEPWRTC